MRIETCEEKKQMHEDMGRNPNERYLFSLISKRKREKH
jgi:hypothetical protein